MIFRQGKKGQLREGGKIGQVSAAYTGNGHGLEVDVVSEGGVRGPCGVGGAGWRIGQYLNSGDPVVIQEKGGSLERVMREAEDLTQTRIHIERGKEG